MATMGLSAEKCSEILQHFRCVLPDISDELLKEFAGYYALDAPVDIDPNEIMDLLTIPGPRLVLRSLFMEGCCIDKSLNSLFDDTIVGGIDLTTVAGVLVFIKIKPKSSLSKTFSAASQCLPQFLHPGASARWGVYIDTAPGNLCDALVVLSGIGTSHEVLTANIQNGSNEELSRSQEMFDLPAFLKTP